jgi:hypothetical protein
MPSSAGTATTAPRDLTSFRGSILEMARRARTPQEKKRLSLDRDTPLSAKYPKAFRKQWPLRKAKAQRAFRRAQRKAVDGGEADAPVARETVRKWPQPRLGEVVARHQQRRAALQIAPRKSAAARARRAQKRGRPASQ